MVLIGPAATGKSTLGAIVAASTGRPFVDIDEIGAAYYAEAGWSMDRLRAHVEAVGRVRAEREWEPARAHAVRRAVADHPGAVLSLGAGHSNYTDPALFDEVRKALGVVEHVVLVLPSPDQDRSVAVLRERSLATKQTGWVTEDGHDFLAEWVRDRGNADLATVILHTDGEDPPASARRLSELLRAADQDR